MSDKRNYRGLPISSAPLNGKLYIQRRINPDSSWELSVGHNQDELKKLPDFPITHIKCTEGIAIVIEYKGKPYPAAFHGYDESSKKGRRFYIGSRGKQGRTFTESYKDFLRDFGVRVGVDIDPINVTMDFRSNNVVAVSYRYK